LPDIAADADQTQVDATVVPPEVTAPPPPVLIDVSARDGGLLVRWRKAAGADGYALLVGTSAGNYADPVDVGDVSEYVVGGLQNGVRYYVAAKSYAEGGYMFSVICTANGTRSYPSNPATAVLERVESGASDELPGTPAELRGWPPLEDNGYGCFIGAAAAPSFSGAAAATAAAAAAFLLAAGRAFWRKWGRILALLILILVGHSAIAATREPRLAFGLVGGAFLPRESGWADNYDDDILPTGRASFGLRLTRFLEVGLGGGYWQAKGSVAVDESGAPLAVPADQTLTVVPTHAYLLVDLSLSTDQLLVPYLAGGYSRYFYRRKVDGGDTVRGHLSGYHGRGGVKLLLNRIDPASASVAQVTFGLQRTYWLVEGEYDRIDDFGDSSTDLGGWSVLSGFLLEF
jgi:hypothetical protein